MAKKDFTQLTAAESVALTDILAVVVDPSGSPATRKATLQKLKDLLLTSENLAALNVITSDDIDDYLAWQDTVNGLIYNSDGSGKNIGVGEANPDKALVVGGDFKIKKGIIPANYNLSGAVYSKQIDTQDATPTGIAWNDDGTKLYEVGLTSDKIYEYNVSTPFDISTAVYSGVNIDTQDSQPTGIAWNDDGTKLYEVGLTSNKIYEYNVSTPFDISTAVYSTFINTQDAAPQGITWNNDGTKLYEVGSGSDKIYEYNVSTPFDISTAVYSTFINTQDAVPQSIAWNNDGTKLYEVGSGSDKIYEYNVSTPYAIATAVYSTFISTQDSLPQGITWNNDGTKLYEIGNGSDKIYEYDITAGFFGGDSTHVQLSADPDDPAEGESVEWYSDGTESGNAGDKMAKINVGGTVTTRTIIGYSQNVTTVNAATYDLLTTDYILNVTYTGTGAVTSLTLPSAQTVAGRVIIVKDAGGNANTNNITIDTEGDETIDGSATNVINSDYGSVHLYSDGSNWFII
jgi:sugar lactone lactonase YvrE